MVRRPFGHGPVARFLRRASLLALLLGGALWGYVQLDRRTLPGLTVRGVALASTQDPTPRLRAQARRWGQEVIELYTGPHLTRAPRAHLGAQLDAEGLARRLLAIGRGGNPLVDLVDIVSVPLSGRAISWTADIDRIALGRYVQAIRRNVERAPVAGATDEQGWSIPGVPGVTLDTVSTVAALEHALRHDLLRVDVPLRQIPPPQAVAIGSPDAVLYDEHDAETAAAREAIVPGELAEALQAAQPRAWAPSRGEECDMDPPYERFCQGPRRVPLPWGEAEARAERLGLGDVRAVSRLLRSGPSDEWVAAVRQRFKSWRGAERSLLWPVVGGRLWRGFGYVRRGALRDKLHRGIDVGAPRGTPIVAAGDALVIYSDNGIRGYGNMLLLVHSDGSATLHAHCRAIYMFAGQYVRRGRIVAEVGDTGIARGAHLHFEYHVGGRPADPDGLFTRPWAKGGP